jgi:phosphopantetheinyl transferase
MNEAPLLLWLARVDAADATVGAAAAAALPAPERARLARLRRPADAAMSAAGQWALRLAVAEAAGADGPARRAAAARAHWARSPEGRPRVRLLRTGAAGVGLGREQDDEEEEEEEELDGNVSHDGAWLAVAAARRPGVRVGVDVVDVPLAAARGVSAETLAAVALSPAERAWAGGVLRRALTLWALKEAILKADGRGLALEPARVELRRSDAGAWLADVDGAAWAPPGCLDAAVLEDGALVLAVAARPPPHEPPLRGLAAADPRRISLAEILAVAALARSRMGRD